MVQKHGTHWLERQDIANVTVVRLKVPQRVDDEIVRAVFEPILSLVDDVGRKMIVLNLATASYLPSLALGKLVLLNRKLDAVGGRLALCHITPIVREILDTTHIADVLAIYGTEEEALASFSADDFAGD